MIAEQIGSQIRHMRKLRGLTQDQLADMVGGGGKQFINKVELGKKHITIAMMEKICAALDCNMQIRMSRNYKIDKSQNILK